MNREDIIKLAQEADLHAFGGDVIEALERFAALIATAAIKAAPDYKMGYADGMAAEREMTNNAYRERNQLVALLSILFSSGKAKTAIEGWDEAWHGCIYIDFPWGQASWHYHTDDEEMFAHLLPYTKLWDGHTTEAKYAAIASAIRARGQA